MRTLFLTVAILAAGFAYGQNSPQISVSTEKVNVNGEIMYVHNVKGKETLYSIAKAYNVSIDDIVRTNEQLKGGLKEGSKIYIPSGGAAPEAVPASAITAEKAETVVAKESPASEKKNKLSGSEIKKYSKNYIIFGVFIQVYTILFQYAHLEFQLPFLGLLLAILFHSLRVS